MKELAGWAAAMVIIGGDFNAAADADEFLAVQPPSGSVLVDCRRLAGVPAAATCAGDGDGACIDHILMLVSKDRQDCMMVSVSNVLDRPDPETGLMASDHFGVKMSIRLHPADLSTTYAEKPRSETRDGLILVPGALRCPTAS
jgi:endonuclease/exonuclease/phosphatase family metal-dependent hydrolase